MRHMALTVPFLKLQPAKNGFELYWKGENIGALGDWAGLRTLAPERLFSIGSGPSIADQTFEHINGSECVLVNGAIQLVIDGRLNGCFAVMIEDPRFVYERIDMLMELPKGTRLCMVAHGIQALGMLKGVEGLRHFDLYVIDRFDFPYGKPKRDVHEAPAYTYRSAANANLSLDLQQGHFGCGTVMYCGIQMAFHLRVKQLYLVGFDLTNFEQPRFYETKDDAAWTGLQNAYENRILPALELTMKTAEEFNMQVYNCSHTSIIPRSLIPFSDILMPT